MTVHSDVVLGVRSYQEADALDGGEVEPARILVGTQRVVPYISLAVCHNPVALIVVEAHHSAGGSEGLQQGVVHLSADRDDVVLVGS